MKADLLDQLLHTPNQEDGEDWGVPFEILVRHSEDAPHGLEWAARAKNYDYFAFASTRDGAIQCLKELLEATPIELLDVLGGVAFRRDKLDKDGLSEDDFLDAVSRVVSRLSNKDESHIKND